MSIGAIDVARVCHEALRAYCTALGEPPPPAWDQLPREERESTAAGVFFILEHPLASVELCHDNWYHDRLEDGWQWSLTRDSAKKLHPNMLPYAQLPEAQKLKPALFLSVVRALEPTFLR